MRAAIFVVIAGVAAALSAIGACSSFTPAGDEDAGTTTQDAAPPIAVDADAADATSADGFAPTPGIIGCFGKNCDLSKGVICCADYDASTTACSAESTCMRAKVVCDDAADCAPGKVCCLGTFASSTCETACNPDTSFFPSYQLCRSNVECGEGQTCVPVECFETTIGVCGAAAAKVRMLCNADAGDGDGG